MISIDQHSDLGTCVLFLKNFMFFFISPTLPHSDPVFHLLVIQVFP